MCCGGHRFRSALVDSRPNESNPFVWQRRWPTLDSRIAAAVRGVFRTFLGIVCLRTYLLCPAPNRQGHQAMMLSHVCLTSVCRVHRNREASYRKTKIGTEVAHVTRDSDTTFKVKRSKAALVTAALMHQQLRRWPWERIHRGKFTATLRSGAVGSAARGASAPTEGGGGGGISWRPPDYSLFIDGQA